MDQTLKELVDQRVRELLDLKVKEYMLSEGTTIHIRRRGREGWSEVFIEENQQVALCQEFNNHPDVEVAALWPPDDSEISAEMLKRVGAIK